MRYFCLIIIFIVCALIGYQIKNRYRQQCVLLNQIDSFIDFLYPNINLYKNNLSDIINNYLILQNNKNAKNYKIFHKNNNLYQINNVNIDDIICNKIVKSNLELFFNNIGKLDLDGECERIKNFRKELNKYIINAEKDLKEKGELYFKISLSIGLILCVILW